MKRAHLMLFLPAMAFAACGDDGEPDPFSPEELSSIRERLGILADSPPNDPTNAYADNADAGSLGQKLFFETGYSGVQHGTESGTETMACATCHAPSGGFQDNRGANTSSGPVPTIFTGRHAPTIINAAYGAGVATGEGISQFWDGRKDSQWAQALGPPESDVEMGGTRTAIAYLLREKYQNEYEAVFGGLNLEARTPPLSATVGSSDWNALSEAHRGQITRAYVNFGKAIAAYERRVICRSDKWEQFWRDIASGANDSTALSAEEKLGLKVFVGKGKCVECHNGPNFTDWEYHNLGLNNRGPHLPDADEGRAAGIAGVQGDEFNCASDWSDHPDKSQCKVNDLPAATDADLGAFKTPGLLCAAQTAPYMHTGTLASLDDVIDFYNRGGDEEGFVGARDEKMQVLELTLSEKAALKAFLLALDGAIDPSLTRAP